MPIPLKAPTDQDEIFQLQERLLELKFLPGARGLVNMTIYVDEAGTVSFAGLLEEIDPKERFSKGRQQTLPYVVVIKGKVDKGGAFYDLKNVQLEVTDTQITFSFRYDTRIEPSPFQTGL